MNIVTTVTLPESYSSSKSRLTFTQIKLRDDEDSGTYVPSEDGYSEMDFHEHENVCSLKQILELRPVSESLSLMCQAVLVSVRN